MGSHVRKENTIESFNISKVTTNPFNEPNYRCYFKKKLFQFNFCRQKKKKQLRKVTEKQIAEEEAQKMQERRDEDSTTLVADAIVERKEQKKQDERVSAKVIEEAANWQLAVLKNKITLQLKQKIIEKK